MDRGWYFRFVTVVAVVVLGWLALWPSLDQWVSAPAIVKQTFQGRISPGLDIQGGMRLQYEVEVDEAIRDRRDRLAEQLKPRLAVLLGLLDEAKATTASRDDLKKVDERATVENVDARGIRVTFKNEADSEKLTNDVLRTYFPELRRERRESGRVYLTMDPEGLERLRQTAVDQAVKTVSSRIDELGVRDMSIQGRDEDLIIEIPGASDDMFNRIRAIVARTARLEFKIADDENRFFDSVTELPEGIEKRNEQVPLGPGRDAMSTYLAASGEGSKKKLVDFIATLTPPPGDQIVVGPVENSVPAAGASATEEWRTYLLHASTDVTGEDVAHAQVGFDQNNAGQPIVLIEFNSRGADAFGRLTGANVGRRMAIVLDDVAESAPRINERIGAGHCQITLGSMGDYNSTLNEANDLVVVLRAGALPAPIRPANEQLIGPTLGQDAVEKGVVGAAIGILFVLVFMAFYYQVAGLVADIMVVLNVMLLLALLAALEATLTLPGIAGIALTVGMAVDANVLITERIREELRLGKSPRAAVEQGYSRAFWSIFDSQLTTFIAGVVMFQYGTGPIRGFAVTLIVGIVTSLFTGVFCSKVFMDFIVRGLRVERLRVG